jgi:hypothetical protein
LWTEIIKQPKPTQGCSADWRRRLLVGEVSVKRSVVGKQNQVRVHFVIRQKINDPRIHQFGGTTLFLSCNFLP